MDVDLEYFSMIFYYVNIHVNDMDRIWRYYNTSRPTSVSI